MYHHRREFGIIARKALAYGASYGLGTGYKWNVAGNCISPIYREISTSSCEQMIDGDISRQRYDRCTIELYVRCRQCPNCMRVRSAYWRRRAETELVGSVRTWFGTLTLSAEQQFKAGCAAQLRLARAGTDFDALTEDEQFSERCKEISGEITRFLKRVRKNSGARLRYCLVTERHKSGLPHYHMLIHERLAEEPVRHKILTEAWHLGFTNFKLVKSGEPAARYLCKYLAKSACSRVRASVGYGHIPLITVYPVQGNHNCWTASPYNVNRKFDPQGRPALLDEAAWGSLGLGNGRLADCVEETSSSRISPATAGSDGAGLSRAGVSGAGGSSGNAEAYRLTVPPEVCAPAWAAKPP